MTTPRHLELFIRDNKTVAQCRTETNGRLDDPVSIAVAGPEWTAFLAAWNQTQAAEIVALTAGRDALQTSLREMTAGRDAQKAIAETVSDLQEQLATLTAEKSALQAEVDRLTALVPPVLPERSIYPRELLGRLTKAEIVAAIRTDNEDVIFAVANLQTTVSPVLLDSEEVRMMIGSLVVAGILTPERMAEVLA